MREAEAVPDQCIKWALHSSQPGSFSSQWQEFENPLLSLKNTMKRQLRKSGGSITKRGFYTHRATQVQIISNLSVDPNLSSIYARKHMREVRNLVTYCKICCKETCTYPEPHSTWLHLQSICHQGCEYFQVQHSVISRASFNLVILATHVHIHNHLVGSDEFAD